MGWSWALFPSFLFWSKSFSFDIGILLEFHIANLYLLRQILKAVINRPTYWHSQCTAISPMKNMLFIIPLASELHPSSKKFYFLIQKCALKKWRTVFPNAYDCLWRRSAANDMNYYNYCFLLLEPENNRNYCFFVLHSGVLFYLLEFWPKQGILDSISETKIKIGPPSSNISNQ